MSLERQAERSKHAKAHAGCGGGRSTTHRVQFALSHPGHTPLVASGTMEEAGRAWKKLPQLCSVQDVLRSLTPKGSSSRRVLPAWVGATAHSAPAAASSPRGAGHLRQLEGVRR